MYKTQYGLIKILTGTSSKMYKIKCHILAHLEQFIGSAQKLSGSTITMLSCTFISN